MPAPQHTHYDVLIIGAGMVGSSLACALTSSPKTLQHKFLVVEASAINFDSAPLQPGYDSRSTVLSAGSVSCFQQLGLWEACSAAAEAITDIHVSDQGRFGSIRLSSSEEEVSALGYVVENSALGSAINRTLLQRSQLELCAPASVLSVKPCDEGMQVLLHTPHGEIQLTAALVVLAEGGRSGLCQQLGIHHTQQVYEQTALIANVSFTKPHHNVAYERFTAKGPLALLPLPEHKGEHRAALVWTHSQTAASRILDLPEAEFLTELHRDFGDRLGAFTRVGKRMAFPLTLQLAEEQIRPALVLLGNVAHTLHPVAGQGFNLALRDTMILADNILHSLQMQQNPGDFRRLQDYLQAVELDQQLTVRFSDYMTRLFSSSSKPLIWARQWGMACIDMLPPLRHGLSRQAMGLAHARVRL